MKASKDFQAGSSGGSPKRWNGRWRARRVLDRLAARQQRLRLLEQGGVGFEQPHPLDLLLVEAEVAAAALTPLVVAGQAQAAPLQQFLHVADAQAKLPGIEALHFLRYDYTSPRLRPNSILGRQINYPYYTWRLGLAAAHEARRGAFDVVLMIDVIEHIVTEARLAAVSGSGVLQRPHTARAAA